MTQIKSGYFILKLSQIGNVGAHEIKPIKEQPDDGFQSEELASEHLAELLTNKGTFSFWWDHFTIMKLYIPPKQ